MTYCGTLTQSSIKNNVYFHVCHFSAVSGKTAESVALTQAEQSVGSWGRFALMSHSPGGVSSSAPPYRSAALMHQSPPAHTQRPLEALDSVGVMTEIPIARCAVVVIEHRGTRFPRCVETHSVVHETSPPAVGLRSGGEWGRSTSSCGSLLSSVSPAPAVTCSPKPWGNGV